MSIIHDALKKVQSKTAADGSTPGPYGPGPGQTMVDVNPRGVPQAVLAGLAISISVALLVIFAVLFRLAREATTHSGKPAALAVSVEREAKPLSFAEAVKHAIAGPLRTVLPVKVHFAAPPAPAAVVPEQQPPAVSEPEVYPPGTLRLEGIMDKNGKRVALINGEVYEEGQFVQDKDLVTEISNNSVTLADNGNKKTLLLRKK